MFETLVDNEDAYLCEIDEKNKKKKLDLIIDFTYNSELIEFLALIKECRQLCEEYWAKFVEKNELSMHQSILWTKVTYGTLLSNQTKFYQFCSITEQDFLRCVDTGDVILMRSNNLVGPWITRTFTKSHYDHVGIILRFGDLMEDLYIMEAIGEEGVRLNPWYIAR